MVPTSSPAIRGCFLLPNEPFTLYDPTTDECPTPKELLKNLDQLSDNDLLDLLFRAISLQADLDYTINILKSTVSRRMTEREATLMDTLGFTAKLEKKVTYFYDLPLLQGELKPLLTAEQWEKAVPTPPPPEPKPNKTELNKLTKLGGKVKEIIEEAVTPVPAPPSLKVERKAHLQGAF